MSVTVDERQFDSETLDFDTCASVQFPSPLIYRACMHICVDYLSIYEKCMHKHSSPLLLLFPSTLSSIGTRFVKMELSIGLEPFSKEQAKNVMGSRNEL